jgi:hypothetical protein
MKAAPGEWSIVEDIWHVLLLMKDIRVIEKLSNKILTDSELVSELLNYKKG